MKDNVDVENIQESESFNELENNIINDKEVLKKALQSRLRRIEGQVKGIEKMVVSDASCKEILIQIAAIRAAINKVGAIVLENYAKHCVSSDGGCTDKNENIDELITTLLLFLK